MTRNELVRYTASSLGRPVEDVREVVDAFLLAMERCFELDEDVKLMGLGSFVVSKKSDRIRRSPLTGEEVNVPASRTIRFRVSKRLKDRLNGERSR